MTTREEIVGMSKVERANRSSMISKPVTVEALIGALDDLAGGARPAKPRVQVRPPSARS